MAPRNFVIRSAFRQPSNFVMSLGNFFMPRSEFVMPAGLKAGTVSLWSRLDRLH